MSYYFAYLGHLQMNSKCTQLQHVCVWLTEEQMLHEEVDLKWEEMQAWVQDFQLLERLRADLVVGVSTNQF
jgi:hypothetical protein